MKFLVQLIRTQEERVDYRKFTSIDFLIEVVQDMWDNMDTTTQTIRIIPLQDFGAESDKS